jgi:hypothetical protein
VCPPQGLFEYVVELCSGGISFTRIPGYRRHRVAATLCITTALNVKVQKGERWLTSPSPLDNFIENVVRPYKQEFPENRVALEAVR